MKITSSNSASPSAVGPGGRRAPGAAFSLSETEGAAGPAPKAPTTAVSSLGSVDALIALQEVDGPLERKRRAVRRATRVLDALDRIKLALLEGRLSPADLRQLADSVREQRIATDDPRLQEVLDQIETRAAVELAKAEAARAGP